ncbi:hypothetical protein H2198_004554 [Neophaeococcomyces mojaviensis]|uniref:Uncharacterized protein n=1 Tax=Neophaeococcomyces mojaviensis TaxID=3383035 RepID=A0ACC3A870_9EURO|nr:hypothetical protein H2198_004554 [Knufia sp. JES_112]
MADFSSFTHKWRATTNNDHRSDTNKVTKRNRLPVSCVPCRTRKLKCDRGHPCDACLKRNDQESCLYGKVSAAAVPPNGSARKDETSRTSNLKAQARLEHLEELVKSLVGNPSQADAPAVQASSPPAEIHDATPEKETLKRVADGGSYNGSTHWSAVLQHIYELKSDLESGSTEYDDVPEPVDFAKPDALFGGQRPLSLHHILQKHLPDRIHVDRRISQYFNAKYMIVPFIHMKQFRRQYEEFWKNPLEANVIWISQMFSICYLAASLSMVSNKSPDQDLDAKNTRGSFEAATGQCLLLGNYSKPQPYVVEALGLFLQCKYASSLDPSREVALVFAVQTRLAYMMGYHRDGSKFPGQFTPFQAEMRRRTWSILKQFDLMTAFQLGIPNNVPPGSFDTANPSNLLDTDFDEDSRTLPPSRPEHEISQMLYFVVKSRLTDVYTKICQHAISFPSTAPTVSEIMALDAQIRQLAETVPQALRVKPVSQSITDQGCDIMVRLNISFLWRKSLCVLHRKYMTASGNDYSYDTCIESASAMCATIIDLYPEFRPGGTFENDSWMLTSFTIIDFLLAAMVLCLAMSVSRKKYVNTGSDPQKWLLLDGTKTVFEILDNSKRICTELGQRSREAKRVSCVLSAVLERLRTREQSAPTSIEGSSAQGANSILSMTPLSLQEGLTSVTPSSGMVPPEWYMSDKTTESTPASNVGQIELSPTKPSTSPMEIQQTLNTGLNMGYDVHQNRFPLNAYVPPAWNMDLGFGPFSTILDGPEGSGSIDWTQLDQFTGFYGNESGLFLPDSSASTHPNVSNMSNDTTYMDYGNWESTPIYNLGGRAREPISGKSQQP